MPRLPRLAELDERIERWLTRWQTWLLIGSSLVYLAAVSLVSQVKLLWYDELFTLHLARLPRLADLWAALASGTDLNPPLSYLAARGAQALFGEHRLAIRLPAMLGFWIMGLCLFRFASRRCPRAYAWLALLVPLASALYPCAWEARPYALVLGLAGIALLCWQSASEDEPRTIALCGLGTSLALALLCHYYAVLLLVPFGLGELVRQGGQRRWDRAMTAALVLPLLALTVLMPWMVEARSYAGTFWARPSYEAVQHTYGFLLAYLKAPVLAALGVAAICGLGQRLLAVGRYTEASMAPAFTPARLHEVVVLLGLCALPVWGFLLGKYVTGAYLFRYVFPAIVGLALLFVLCVSRLSGGCSIVGVTAAVAFLALFMEGEVRNYKRLARRSAEVATTCAFLEGLTDQKLPIVISDPQAFLQLAYYAPADIGARLVYLSDAEQARRRLGQDTAERALSRLAHFAALRVAPYQPFIAAHPRFLVYDHAGWLPSALEARGMSIVASGLDRRKPLYLAEEPVVVRALEKRAGD
jgi:hypothetical protein